MTMNTFSRLLLTSCLCLPLAAQDPAVKPAPAAQDPPKPASAPAKQEAPKTLALGQRANGEISLPDLDGKPVKAHEQMGKITVVNFYSITCPIQAAWDNRLATIQKDFEGKGVTFLHIDSNTSEIDAGKTRDGAEVTKEQRLQAIRDHLKKKNLPFRVLLDQDNKVADFFEAKTTPHVYVFGKDGKLVYKGLVDDDQKDANADKRNNYLRDTLGKLLKGEKVEPSSTKEMGCTIKRVSGDKGARPAGGAKDAGGK
jgi:peroxiredoxin